MKKKHTFACIFMALAIACSIPLGVNRSLVRLREKAAESYYYDAGGYALYEGLEKRQEAASSLVTLAKRYVEKEPSLNALADELEYRVSAAERAYSEDDTFSQEAETNMALDDPAQELANALEQVELAEKDQKYPAQLIAQMKSEQDKINRSSYNDDARAFNAKAKRLKPIALVNYMAVFDQQSDSGAVAVEQADMETTGIPSPPDAPKAPEAPEVPGVEGFVEDTVDRAEEFSEDMTGWAEEFSGEMIGWAEDFTDEITTWAEEYADSVTEKAERAVRG